MGSYVFKWVYPASEVWVSGTFDDWGKTIKLDKVGNVHEKRVEFKQTHERILYKFIVDGNWTTDTTKKTETDRSGYSNNVLDPHDIIPNTISNTAGNTTTQALAGQVPKEGSAATVSNTSDNQTTQALAGQVPKEDGATISNTAGNQTTQALAGQVPKEDSATISNTASNQTTQGLAGQVAKEGAAEGVPGAFPETPGDTEVKVNPIAASAGAGNPIQLKAGEPVPKSTGNVTDAVTTSKAAYEKGGAPQLPSVVTPEAERSGGFLGLGTDMKNIIPESSLPIVGGAGTNVTNTVGTGATTTQLAGEVPIEPRGVPTVVSESQEKAHASPEASTNPEAVKEKSQVEKELEKKVPEEPAATESTIGGKAAATIGAAATGVTAAAAGATAYVTSGKAKEDAKEKLPESTHSAVDKVAPDGAAQTASSVPDVVQESIKDAHKGPEAAANKTAVAEKAEVESELLKKVKHEDSAGEPAPTASAATTTTAPKPTTGKAEETVRDSARGTDTKPPGAMAQALKASKSDSRDVSPMTRDDGTHATEHVGGSSKGATLTKLKDKAAATSSPTSSNQKSPTSAKDKRSSGFFRKLKEKFEHHDKKHKG